jgi:hypothetical protein
MIAECSGGSAARISSDMNFFKNGWLRKPQPAAHQLADVLPLLRKADRQLASP